MIEEGEEQDVQLQLQSAAIITQIEDFLPLLLRNSSGECRKLVSGKKTTKLIGLVSFGRQLFPSPFL